jgi:hypothetical protein
MLEKKKDGWTGAMKDSNNLGGQTCSVVSGMSRARILGESITVDIEGTIQPETGDGVSVGAVETDMPSIQQTNHTRIG